MRRADGFLPFVRCACGIWCGRASTERRQDGSALPANRFLSAGPSPSSVNWRTSHYPDLERGAENLRSVTRGRQEGRGESSPGACGANDNAAAESWHANTSPYCGLRLYFNQPKPHLLRPTPLDEATLPTHRYRSAEPRRRAGSHGARPARRRTNPSLAHLRRHRADAPRIRPRRLDRKGAQPAGEGTSGARKGPHRRDRPTLEAVRSKLRRPFPSATATPE